MKDPILVIGGAGFIGSCLVNKLAQAGHDVHVLDLATGEGILPETVTFHHGSILDPRVLQRAMRGKGTVFHLAAVAQLWAPDPEIYDKVNHQGTRTVIEAAMREGIQHLLVTSTSLILRGWRDVQPTPITAGNPLPPLEEMPGPYTRSKWRAHRAVEEAIQQGLPATILYPTVPIGPPGAFITDPTEMPKQFLSTPPMAYLETTLNLIDVEDAAEAHLLAAEKRTVGERFLLAGDDMPFRQFLQVLETVSKKRMPHRRIPYLVAAMAGHLGESLSRLTGKRPAATVEGVRSAKNPSSHDATKTRERLAWQPRSAEAAVTRTARALLKDDL